MVNYTSFTSGPWHARALIAPGDKCAAARHHSSSFCQRSLVLWSGTISVVRRQMTGRMLPIAIQAAPPRVIIRRAAGVAKYDGFRRRVEGEDTIIEVGR